jgi:hypothetical protein
MLLMVEGIVNGGMDIEKTLRGSGNGGSTPPPLFLSTSKG